jgi:putative transposase
MISDGYGRPRQWRWQLDEVFVKVNGKQAGVDREGEVVEMVGATELDEVDSIVKKYGLPRSVVRDGLYAYLAATLRTSNAGRYEGVD